MQTCELCGQAFQPVTFRKKFCSAACKRKFHNDIWNERARVARGDTPGSIAKAFGVEARKVPLTEECRHAVVGTLLGDGSLIRLVSSARLSITHSHKQADYLRWKLQFMRPIFHKTEPNECSTESFGGNRFLVIGSVGHPELSNLYPVFYQHGIKRLPPVVVDNLTPLSLAIWYQDDGSFLKARQSQQVVLCTDNFPLEDVEYAAESFGRRWGFRTGIYFIKRAGRMFPRIYILRGSVSDFFQLVGPFIAPSMTYKVTRSNLSC